MAGGGGELHVSQFGCRGYCRGYICFVGGVRDRRSRGSSRWASLRARCRLASVSSLGRSATSVAFSAAHRVEPEEAYTGTMTRVGLDVGFTTGGVISWTVFADTNRYAGMLAGTYGGPTAEVSVAAGLGANVLVGGSRRTVALQPLSVQGQVGLDIGAGISALELHPAP